MSPKVPKTYLDARRQEIIEAALECFLEKGFHNTTMQDIYDITKLSPGAVYNYFKGKEDIVAAATEMSQRSNEELIAMAKGKDAHETLRNIGHIVASIWKETDISKATSLDFALYSEAIRNPRIAELLRKNLDAVTTQIAGLVKQSQDDGVINRELGPMAIAQVFVNLINGMKTYRLLYPELGLDSYISVYDSMIGGTFSTQKKKREKM
ncbi:TetR/AcrR family transcriptional regulator [Chloroflexota bacterium]|jgi:AcrR family transcriptional regulator